MSKELAEAIERLGTVRAELEATARAGGKLSTNAMFYMAGEISKAIAAINAEGAAHEG